VAKPRFRKEPETIEELKAEIEFLESRLNGQLDEAIQHRIDSLKEKLKHVLKLRDNR
jgi:hypothetical protein